jgi:hypothetical protein
MTQDLLSLLLDKGILIALLFWLFVQERRERIAAQGQLEDCLGGKERGEVAR